MAKDQLVHSLFQIFPISRFPSHILNQPDGIDRRLYEYIDLASCTMLRDPIQELLLAPKRSRYRSNRYLFYSHQRGALFGEMDSFKLLHLHHLLQLYHTFCFKSSQTDLPLCRFRSSKSKIQSFRLTSDATVRCR